MQAEAKLRTLASANPTLQAFFGTGPFRWFDRRLQPGYLSKGTCVRVKRISTGYLYTNVPTPAAPGGLGNLNKPYFQIDVLDFNATTARNAAQAIINWLGTVSFAETNNFDSPPTSPPHSPNFLLNRRASEEAQVEPPGPAWVEILDFRLYNLEN